MEKIWKIKHSFVWFLKKKKTRFFAGNFFLFLKISFFIFLVCSVIISFWTKNPFSFMVVFWQMITFSLRHDNVNILNDVLINWALYLLVGLAVVVAFRAGIFNIGVSGQMLFSGLYVICLNVIADEKGSYLHALKYNFPFFWFFITLLSAMMASLLIGFIVALLRNKYGINEVITTIFFNWIIWYFVKWFFEKYDYMDKGRSSGFNNDFLTVKLFGRELTYVYFLLLAFVLFYVVYVVINKTTFGYYFKIISKTNDVSLFAGVNKNFYSTMSILFSTLLSGAAGFIYYHQSSISFIHDTIPLIGFEGLTVALVAQSQVIAVFFVALLIGFLRYSLQVVQLSSSPDGTQVPEAFSEIVLGVIILFAVLVPFFRSFSLRKKLSCLFFFLFALTKKFFFCRQLKILFSRVKNCCLKVLFCFSKQKRELLRNKGKEISKTKEKFNNELRNYFWKETRLGKFLRFKKEVYFTYAKYWQVFQEVSSSVRQNHSQWAEERTKIYESEKEELVMIRNKYFHS